MHSGQHVVPGSTTPSADARAPVDEASSCDEVAILRAARTDITCFAPLYDRYAPRLYAFCLRRTGNPQDAEDLTSQTIARALNSLHTYAGGSVAAWLFAIARHTVADHFRAHYRRPNTDTALDRADQMPDPALSPLEQVIQSERIDALRAVIADLPDEDQELLALRIAGGLSATEIGKIIGQRAGTVRVRLHRLLRRLRALIPQELLPEEVQS